MLARVTDEQRELIQAAAVLRTVTQGALEALVSGTNLSPGWLEAFSRHYLLQEVPAPGRALRWRMHAIIRSWMLAHLDRLDADRPPPQRALARWHRRAADYYEQLAGGASSADAFYHRFASGDAGPYLPWLAQMLNAVRIGSLDKALLLADAAAPDNATTLSAALPAVDAAGAHIRAYVAYEQARLADAADDAEQARISYRHVTHAASYARLLQLAGQIAWRRWDCRLAAQRWRQALDLPGGLTAPGDRLATLTALAEATLGCGDLDTATKLVTQARQLLAEAEQTIAAQPHDTTAADMPAVTLATAVAAGRWHAHLLQLAGETALYQGDWARADTLLSAADPPDGRISDPHHRADVLRLRGELAANRWDLPAAEKLLEAAMRAARDCPDTSCRIRVLTAQGMLCTQKSISGSSPLPASPAARPLSRLCHTFRSWYGFALRHPST